MLKFLRNSLVSKTNRLRRSFNCGWWSNPKRYSKISLAASFSSLAFRNGSTRSMRSAAIMAALPDGVPEITCRKFPDEPCSNGSQEQGNVLNGRAFNEFFPPRLPKKNCLESAPSVRPRAESRSPTRRVLRDSAIYCPTNVTIFFQPNRERNTRSGNGETVL